MSASAMTEMVKESRMGAIGSLNTTRQVRQIDLSDFQNRKTQIADQLWDASVDVGFFQLVNHGIPLQRVREAFAMSERFFGLPNEVKPSTRTAKPTTSDGRTWPKSGHRWARQIKKKVTKSPCRA